MGKAKSLKKRENLNPNFSISSKVFSDAKSGGASVITLYKRLGIRATDWQTFSSHFLFRRDKMPDRDPELEAQVLEWIATLTGEVKPDKELYEDFLRDGLVLCKL